MNRKKGRSRGLVRVRKERRESAFHHARETGRCPSSKMSEFTTPSEEVTNYEMIVNARDIRKSSKPIKYIE